MTMSFPRPETRRHIEVADADPLRRGIARGEQLRTTLDGTIAAYDRLFRLGAIAENVVRDDAERLLDRIGEHRPALRAQIEGIAQGAGSELWRVAALNARTEILARSVAVPPGECSTIVRAEPDAAGGTRMVGVQTWDWHMEIAPFWHTIVSRGGAQDYAGITECGILGKIGVNSAGVALHFNILGHRDDRPAGIPMHVLAALVLEEATSAEHAVELVREAPVTSSGSFALFDRDATALLDISPDGVFPAPGIAPGTWLRTNHFLTDRPAAAEKRWLYQPDSDQRWRFLRERLLTSASTGGTDDARRALLATGAGEPPVTCVPDVSLPEGQRWASLATVVLDPAARRADVLDGSPTESATRPRIALTA